MPPTRSLIARIVDEEAAGIQYVGISGSSKDCQDAVLRFIHYGDRITNVRILSSSRDHCLSLRINIGDLVAVKSGFSSGYGGEGPRTFSYVLQALESHGAEIDEITVTPDMLERLDRSALTQADLETIERSSPLRPSRWSDYVYERHWEEAKKGTLLEEEFPCAMPLAIVDTRIMDLALSFWDAPDEKLLVGYRRLEDIVRERTGIGEHGAKLFSAAFHPNEGKLTWSGEDNGERTGKMNLFVGTYMAYRNPRAHRELPNNRRDLLGEFLLLNHLYSLERRSVRSKVRKAQTMRK